jgi:hypothetical protein
MQNCTQSTEKRGRKKYFSEYTPGMEYIKMLPCSDQQIKELVPWHNPIKWQDNPQHCTTAVSGNQLRNICNKIMTLSMKRSTVCMEWAEWCTSLFMTLKVSPL